MSPTKRCPNCGTETPAFARFCPNCAAPFAAQPEEQENESRKAFVPLMGAEGSAPGLPTMPAGPQISAPSIPGMGAGPQISAPSVPGMGAGPQVSAPGVPGMGAGPQISAPGVSGFPAGAQGGSLASHGASTIGNIAGKAATSGLRSKLLGTLTGKIVTAVLATAVVVTGAVGGVALATGHNPLAQLSSKKQATAHVVPKPTATPVPPPPEVTYVGTDGNIWEMTLPNGTPKQLTTDAQLGAVNVVGSLSITYGALTWSPDGSRFAVLRVAARGNSGTPQLLIFSAEGAIVSQATLSGILYNTPFAWSPDGHFIAYREATNNPVNPSDPNDFRFLGKLFIVDAQSGAPVKTITYDAGPDQYQGGGGDILANYTGEVHHAFPGIDTFVWASDQQHILLSYGNANVESALLDLNTGKTMLGYPENASYQPGGTLILGIQQFPQQGGLVLTDATGAIVKTLVPPPNFNSGSQVIYEDYLGQSAWSADGKSIYYEYQDGIWEIGVDGSNPHQIVAGAPFDSSRAATLQLSPRPSPDGKQLLYFQLHGMEITDFSGAQDPHLTGQWFLAQADGTNPVALPQTASPPYPAFGITEIAWRPVK